MGNGDQIMVYQFMKQPGSLISQVAGEQALNLARKISQELTLEAVPKESARVEGGKDNGR
jgi:hypothetical protein